jgi:hypothetical protein
MTERERVDKLGPELRKISAEAEWLERRAPAWLRATRPENRLPVAFAILAAVALQLTIPDRYTLGPRWLIPALELALLAVLVVINPIRLSRATAFGRYASLALVAAITLDNGFSAGFLDKAILTGQASGDAIGLLGAGAAIYLTNIIAFGIWYWELDRGGPFARADATTPYPDFLFPQMSDPDRAPAHWEPRFFDYLYVSFTNVVAFSPTDTMPLSRWAKALMSAQSIVALSTISLVIARAVNVLK